jgi:3-oxoacyl-[acyl-carrier protein] reductase
MRENNIYKYSYQEVPAMKNLKGKTVLITGASGGIGKACALAFADEGCNCVICARRADELEKLAEMIRKKGVRALAVPTDVSDEKQIKALAKKAYAEFGTIDILMCNAGIGWTGPTHLMERADWDAVFGVNFFGTIYCIRNFVPSMVKRREGHVVIVSSAFGLTGIPYGTLYSSSKSALIGLGECLRSELSNSGVGVSTMCPGLIDTNLIANTNLKMVNEKARSLSAMVKPMPVDKYARIVVKSVKKNRGLVVSTALAKAFWITKRASQRLYEFISLLVARSTHKYILSE